MTDVSEWLIGLGGAVAGLVAGALVGPFLGPWARGAARAGRAIAGEQPVDLLVDTDQAIIWAGSPPWVGFGYYFPEGLPTQDPPTVGADWSSWAYKHRGMDAAMTMVQVTIQAKLDVSVVLDAPVVRVVGRMPIEGGVIATASAGGVDLSPRRFAVDLDNFDPPIVDFYDNDHPRRPIPAFKLTAGEVERFHVWAYARGSDLVEWTMEIPAIVNGVRRMLPIAGPNDLVFRTVGQQAPVQAWLRSGHNWVKQTFR